MNTHNIKLILTLCILIAGTSEAYTQKGRISGTIVDGSSGEPLISATVSITGTTRGVLTDLDGKYIFESLDPGVYDITVRYITYTTKNVIGIRVTVNETTILNVSLDPEIAQLGEVTVSAEAIMNNDATLLKYRQKSIGFTDAISAESISRSGGSDAASAMKKVTGATVVGGKYVYVRGLGDRYTNTQLNGLELPTSNPDRKSFQLDLLPSHLLDNIVTLKTFTPDKPGNFSGGLVDITTKGIPEYFYVNLSVKQGYNTMSSMSDILLGEGSGTDWFGKDDGYRSEPGILKNRASTAFPSDTRARLDEEAAQTLNILANAFNINFLPQNRRTGLNQSYSLGFGNRHNLNNKVKLGYSANYSYGLNNSAYFDGRSSRYELIGLYENSETLSPSIDLTDVKGTQAVDWGFLGSAGLIIGTFNKINFSLLRTQSGENTGRFLFGFWEQFNSDDIEYRSRVNQFIERDLASYQLSGSHTINLIKDMRLEWNSAYQINGQNTPDLRFMASESRPVYNNTGNVSSYILGNPNSQFPRPARFFRNLNEEKYSATVDLTLPVNISSSSIRFKSGALYEYTTRDFRERRYEYLQGRGFGLNQFSSEEEYLAQLGIIGYDNRNRPQVGNYVISATTNRSSYDAEQTISAAYGMIEMDLFKNLKLAGGARYETTDLQSVSRDSTLSASDRFGEVKQTDLLPSVIFIFSASENMLFRTSFSRTLARPTFRELSPYVSFDFVGDNLFRGNATLDRTLISNYDVRWEWYPGSTEIVSVSGFYKVLDKPIERVLRFDIGTSAESVQNVDKAMVYGVEFELRKNLGTLNGALRYFDIIANMALIHSVVNIPEAELIQIRQTRQNPPTTRQLSGQSPFVVNIDLSYLNPDVGVSTSLSYNRFGDRLSRVSQGAAPDVYERSYDSLNASFAKRFGNHFTVSLGIDNLLDPYMKYSQEFNNQEYIYQQYKTGTTYSVGVKYSFN
jgi:outer membrane receptor protein involved in Fe transport